MRKIRKFKFELRPREVARRAKRARLELADCGLKEEEALLSFVRAFQNCLEPAVVYQSFPADAPLASLAPVQGLGFSLGIATLGQGPERFVARLLEASDSARVPVARIAESVALGDTVAFVLSLLKQEADEDACDLSPIGLLHGASSLDPVASELQSSKIGVATTDGRLAPLATAAFGVSWLARPRSKKRSRKRVGR